MAGAATRRQLPRREPASAVSRLLPRQVFVPRPLSAWLAAAHGQHSAAVAERLAATVLPALVVLLVVVCVGVAMVKFLARLLNATAVAGNNGTDHNRQLDERHRRPRRNSTASPSQQSQCQSRPHQASVTQHEPRGARRSSRASLHSMSALLFATLTGASSAATPATQTTDTTSSSQHNNSAGNLRLSR